MDHLAWSLWGTYGNASQQASGVDLGGAQRDGARSSLGRI